MCVLVFDGNFSFCTRRASCKYTHLLLLLLIIIIIIIVIITIIIIISCLNAELNVNFIHVCYLQDEKARLEEAIARLGMEEGVLNEEEGERVSAIRQAFQADKDKLTKIKTLLVSVCTLLLE